MREPKTYRIVDNGMFNAKGEEVSDQFFGTESPSIYNTVESREAALYYWINEGLLTIEDIVNWETPLSLINQNGDLVPVTYEQNGYLSGSFDNPECDTKEYCKTTTIHCTECGKTWDREEYSGGNIFRGSSCNCR